MIHHPSFLVTVTCSIIFGFVQPVEAVNYILNGNFETSVSGTDKQLGYNSNPKSYNTDATNWSGNGYNFLYSPGKADTTGATNDAPTQRVNLWSTNNGGVSFMPAASPAGGNYIAADGNFGVGAITQVVTGLTAGQQYELKFYWAAAQQKGYDGATTSKFQVSLGTQTFTTPTYALPNHAFSGWMEQAYTFTASSATPLLSFLAIGTPAGLPPFALLDGVSLQAIPEPSSYLIAGVLACGITLRRYRRPHQA